MADHSLSLSALRVAVYAPRDGEMRALARELATARRDHLDLSERFEWMQARHDTYIVALIADIAMLQQQLDARVAVVRMHAEDKAYLRGLAVENARLRQQLEIARANSLSTYSDRFDRETHLARGADRLARWAAQGRAEEDMPFEVWRAVQLMRQEEAPVEDESEMAEPAPAGP
jgi:ABC-type arginine transport system ATPase subunit